MTYYVDVPRLGTAELIGFYNNGRNVMIKDICSVFSKALKKRLKYDLQNVVVVDGHTGSGKSTFAIQLARTIDPKWRLSENYIYSVDDLKRKLENPRASPVSLFDEGSIILNSGNSVRNTDKELVTLFDTMRTKHWTTIVCCPNIFKLNKTFRQQHIDFRCLCPSESPLPGYPSRGFVQIYYQQSGEWSDKVWFPPIATGVFGKLPRAVQVEYNSIKSSKQDILINKFIKMEDD